MERPTLFPKSCISPSLATPISALRFSTNKAVLAASPLGYHADKYGHTNDYYFKCMIGGVFSCGLTHTAIVPLDLVKCRMQTNPEVYPSIGAGFRQVVKESGTFGLSLGWLPTLIGYSMQGLCKFGFYEIFKDLYSDVVGEENAHEYRTFVYLIASASAEVIADVALCPMEAVKVRMQTSDFGIFPTTLGPAVSQIRNLEGMNGFYKGITPLWGRQVPYTMVKFAAFERTVEAFYKYIFTGPKEDYSRPTQLSITFASGYIAGVFCAIVSHPADTIVSKLNKNANASIGQIISEMGIVQLATKGLGARIIMIGTLTGLQWWIYDTFKSLMGFKTSGGK